MAALKEQKAAQRGVWARTKGASTPTITAGPGSTTGRRKQRPAAVPLHPSAPLLLFAISVSVIASPLAHCPTADHEAPSNPPLLSQVQRSFTQPPASTFYLPSSTLKRKRRETSGNTRVVHTLHFSVDS